MPFLNSVAHRLADSRLDPRHKRTVKVETVPALSFEKASDLLCVPI
jgi:hypothetical protein